MAKKIVILSQVIFPRQSPRSMRATELAKEFARQGYDVTLYAVLGQYDYQEFSNNTGIKVKSLGKVFFNELDSDGVKKRNFIYKLIKKLLHYSLDFPDIELMFKVKDVLKSEKNIDLLITIGIPYSIHWGAALCRTRKNKSFPKLWVADCGDPYMGNKFKKHPFYFKYVEKWFMKKVDLITVPFSGAIYGYYEEFRSKIKVIPQGFNFDEFKIEKDFKSNDVITFLYSGVLYKNNRDPSSFLQFLTEIDQEFKFIIYTKSVKIVEPFLDKLSGKLEVRDYINRSKLIFELSKADFLVNFENSSNVQLPSKLIDYSLSGRPILSINPDELDKTKIRNFLRGDYKQELRIQDVNQYDIKNVVAKFLELN